jgi:hypothetical protein
MSRMTEEEEAFDKLEQLGKLPGAISLEMLKKAMNDYIDESPRGSSSDVLEGHKGTTEFQAKFLFQDFIIFLEQCKELYEVKG